MKIGVFDSGIGGLSVANAIGLAMPYVEVVFRHDTADHFPYASKAPDQIYEFVVPILKQLIEEECKVIVVACNTVTTTLIDRLREQFDVPLVGIEPMVKPAAERTNSGVVAVCATPATLASERYHELKHAHAKGITVIEPDCSDWSELIEHNHMNEEKLREDVTPSLSAGADVIVLGCTHYHWIEDEIKEIVGDRAIILQPEQAIISQLKRVLARLA